MRLVDIQRGTELEPSVKPCPLADSPHRHCFSEDSEAVARSLRFERSSNPNGFYSLSFINSRRRFRPAWSRNPTLEMLCPVIPAISR